MTDPYADFQRALTSALDHIRSFVPPSFEVNLILRHEIDPKAHMLLGQSGVPNVKQAIDEILADPGHFAMDGSADDGFMPLVLM